MSSEKTLVIVAALSLILGTSATYADGNFSNIMQSGSDNNGVLVQGPGTHNSFGKASDAALQQGARNSFDVLQQGNRNAAGTDGLGFEQVGNRNTATVTQTSDRNSVGEMRQLDETGSNANARNTLTVLQQGGAANTIGSILQRRTDDGFFANFAAGNSAALTQGAAASGGKNTIRVFSQSGRANAAAVSQTSGNNTVDAFRQDGNGNSASFIQRGGNANIAHTISQNGAHNVLGLTFDGARNGADGFAPAFVGSSAFSGFTEGSVTQDGRGNHIDSFNVTGNRNAYALAQHSFFIGNAIDGYVQGDANQFAVSQDGEANGTHIGIAGNRNEVAVSQGGPSVFGVSAGAANDASVTIGGNRNGVMLDQFGFGNEAAATIQGNLNLFVGAQSGFGNRAAASLAGNHNGIRLDQLSLGSGNAAGIDITGDLNFADIRQGHGLFGAGNSLTLDIHGDRNNNPALGAFAGPAALVAASGGLLPGSIVQSGSGNTIAMTVGTASVPANANMFAFAQNGSGNAISGSTIGNNNEVAVVQSGDGNVASFSQLGNGNIIGISQ